MNKSFRGKYVLTGGPGVGKTTVALLLRSMGYKVIPEAPRMIIEEEFKKNPNFSPWRDIEAFQKMVVERQIFHEEEVYKDGLFLDRSIIDGFAYSRFAGISPPDIIIEKGRGRYDGVFVLAPLSFYENDSVRKESANERLKIHEEIKKAYRFFGYDFVEVRDMGAKGRVDFIIDYISRFL